MPQAALAANAGTVSAILTSEHTKAQLDEALETFERVARRLGILQ
jgi:hypothetical protein